MEYLDFGLSQEMFTIVSCFEVAECLCQDKQIKANDCHNHLKLKTNALFCYFCFLGVLFFEKIFSFSILFRTFGD